jgi:hypothetical protein
MFCFFCSKYLTIEKLNLEEHALKHAHKIEKPIFMEIMEYNVSDLRPIIYYIIQSLQSKKLWKSYNSDVMSVDHTKIYAPSLLVDLSEKLIFLINNIFTTNELQTMIAETQ